MLEQLTRVFPDAPIFTSVHAPAGLPPAAAAWDVRPSLLQQVPLARRFSRAFLPLMPFAFAQFDFSGYDVVLTVSSAFSKNVIVPAGAVNLCYCLTPPRYLWATTVDERLTAAGPLAAPLIGLLRGWDLRAAEGVNRFIAISGTVRDRIHAIYNREASVVFPPVNTEGIRPSGNPPEGFYLVVSRLVRQKRIELAVAACTRLGRSLVVVGSGPELPRLRAMAGPTVQFLGTLPDADVFDLYARCRGFLFPGLEDFGITIVEAQSAGRPVVAYGEGGALETVLDGQTGVLFYEQSPQALAAAIARLEQLRLEPEDCRRNALRFSSRIFREAIARAVDVSAGCINSLEPSNPLHRRWA